MPTSGGGNATAGQRDRREARRRRQEEWITHVRSEEGALRANRSSPRLLHQMAEAYFGRLREAKGIEPVTRLRSLLSDDERLVEVVLIALRDAVRRDDLPDAEEIISLRENNQEHYLALPFSAGLTELDRIGQGTRLHLDERKARIALTFRYCGVFNDEPAWHRRLLATNPTLVADVLTRCAKSALRGRRPYVAGLQELGRSENHEEVARVASLPILRSFPVRCTVQQLASLNYLLWSALRHADRASFAQLIEEKLSRTSMNVAQRARWLAAGFVLSPEACWNRRSRSRSAASGVFASLRRSWAIHMMPRCGWTGWVRRACRFSFACWVSRSGQWTGVR